MHTLSSLLVDVTHKMASAYYRAYNRPDIHQISRSTISMEDSNKQGSFRFIPIA